MPASSEATGPGRAKNRVTFPPYHTRTPNDRHNPASTRCVLFLDYSWDLHRAGYGRGVLVWISRRCRDEVAGLQAGEGAAAEGGDACAIRECTEETEAPLGAAGRRTRKEFDTEQRKGRAC